MKKCCTVLVVLRQSSLACHLAPAVGSPAATALLQLHVVALPTNHQTAATRVTTHRNVSTGGNAF